VAQDLPGLATKGDLTQRKIDATVAIDRSKEREMFDLFVAAILVAMLRISAASLPGKNRCSFLLAVGHETG